MAGHAGAHRIPGNRFYCVHFLGYLLRIFFKFLLRFCSLYILKQSKHYTFLNRIIVDQSICFRVCIHIDIRYGVDGLRNNIRCLEKRTITKKGPHTLRGFVFNTRLVQCYS